jgi:hypothetical protein
LFGCSANVVDVDVSACGCGSERVEADVVVVVGRCRSCSGCLAVLVHEAAAGRVLSDRSAGPIRDDFGIVWCALAEAAEGSVRFVVLDVLGEELFELSVVPDEGAVDQFVACSADPAFRVRVRTDV